MAPINHQTLVFVFGILGNIISFMVYLAPAPTFWRIYKKKSTEGFQSVPYVCAIFSAMLWIYYSVLKSNAMLLITINSAGCVIETVYVVVYLTYADKQTRMWTVKTLVLLNFVGFSAIILACHFMPTVSLQVHVLGWMCVAFSVIVFAAPLSVIRLVMRTKSVEYMPFPLSFFLTISAVLWFMYGMLLMDIYVILPNVLGFTFGVGQMILYGIYRKHKPRPIDEEKAVAEAADAKHPAPSEFVSSRHSVELNGTTCNPDYIPAAAVRSDSFTLKRVVVDDHDNDQNNNEEESDRRDVERRDSNYVKQQQQQQQEEEEAPEEEEDHTHCRSDDDDDDDSDPQLLLSCHADEIVNMGDVVAPIGTAPCPVQLVGCAV